MDICGWVVSIIGVAWISAVIGYCLGESGRDDEKWFKIGWGEAKKDKPRSLSAKEAYQLYED